MLGKKQCSKFALFPYSQRPCLRAKQKPKTQPVPTPMACISTHMAQAQVPEKEGDLKVTGLLGPPAAT